jgi:hypothetical protein
VQEQGPAQQQEREPPALQVQEQAQVQRGMPACPQDAETLQQILQRSR